MLLVLDTSSLAILLVSVLVVTLRDFQIVVVKGGIFVFFFMMLVLTIATVVVGVKI